MRRFAPRLRVTDLLLALPAGGYVALLIGLSVIRLTYPFELEWIEGATVDTIRWLAAGNPLYAAPSVRFIPPVYNPLYYYLATGVAAVAGVGFIAPRLVSLIATLGTLLLLYRLAAGEQSDWVAGLTAAGLYAACFRFAGAWMDIGRNDALFLFCLLLADSVGRASNKPWRLALSGLLYVAAYYTKQNALIVIAAASGATLLVAGRRVWPQWAVMALVGAALFLILDRSSGGWYSFYTTDTLLGHTRSPEGLDAWRRLLKQMAPALLAIGVAGVAAALRSGRGHLHPPCGRAFGAVQVSTRIRVDGFLKRFCTEASETARRLLLDAAFCLGLIASTLSVFVQRWTYDNGFLPACLGIALAAGLGVRAPIGRGSGGRRQEAGAGGRRSAVSRLLLLLTTTLLLGQFVLLRYDPTAQLPTAADRQAGEQFLARLGSLPGTALVYEHGAYGPLAGKAASLHRAHYTDAAGEGSLAPATEDERWRREQVAAVLTDAIRHQAFDWIVVDRPGDLWAPYYVEAERLFAAPEGFFPVTGKRTRPEIVLVKNPHAP